MKIWWHIFNYCIEALLHVKQEPLINVSFESNYSLNVKARCGVSESIRTKIYIFIRWCDANKIFNMRFYRSSEYHNYIHG